MQAWFRRCAVWAAALCCWMAPGARARGAVLPQTYLYLHTEGLELNVSFQSGKGCVPGLSVCGVSDARSNTSWLPDVSKSKITIPPMQYQRFGPNPALVRAALLAEIRGLLAGVNLKVVDQRPPPGSRYSMVVIGGRPQDIGLGGHIAGLAPLDCEDTNPYDITFVFSKSLRSLNAIARVTVQEAAHSYGIEHVRAPDYVMNPEPIGGSMGLGKSCLPLDPSPGLSNPDGIKCLHACEDPSYQNSFVELRRLFGASPLPRSNHPPRIQIRYPGQGNHFFETPADLRLDIDVLSGQDLKEVELSINGGPSVKNSMFPYAYRISGLGPGGYNAKVIARDIHGNQSQEVVDFSVGPLNRQAENAPPVTAQQISLRIERLNGTPVRCVDDRVCYGGTRCQNGLCLRPLPKTGCTLGPSSPRAGWLALIGLFSFWRRRTRR